MTLNKKNQYNIAHHILPFSIGRTFNPIFWGNKKYRKIIGPIQALNNEKLDLKQKTNNYFNIFPKIFFSLAKKLSYHTLKQADKIIVINEYTKNTLIEKGINKNKIIIIPPGIDLPRSKNVFSEKKNEKIIEIITVSYLVKRKRIDLIIKAISEVVKVYKNVKLRIIGDGLQMEALKKITSQLNLNHYVIFEGFVLNNRIQKYYQQAHIFASMSQAESWGQMYLEAMAGGLPVITTKNIGSNEIIKDNKFGYLIPQEDYKELAQKIIYLINHRKLINQFGQNARKEIEKKYDWETIIIPQYLKVYKSVINSKKKYEQAL